MSTMFPTLLTTTLLALGACAASAQEATPDTWISEASSQRSRADVRAEVIAARDSGELFRIEYAGFLPTLLSQPRTRMAVKSELKQAIASGEMAMLSAEAYAFQSLPQHATTRVASK